MDENIEDAFNEAQKQYEGAMISVNERALTVDLPYLAAVGFIKMLAVETQINRAMYDFCRSLEYEVDDKWIREDVHVEFMEGQMTKLDPDLNDGQMVLDIESFFGAIATSIEIYIESRKAEIEREKNMGE